MKPLPPAPLTTEDDWAWDMVMCRKNGRSFGIRSFSVQSDRRDAELLLLAKLNPYYDVLIDVHGERELLIRWGATARMLGLRYTSSNRAEM
jgi:hypothetical protein